jgi:hypothetical protein
MHKEWISEMFWPKTLNLTQYVLIQTACTVYVLPSFNIFAVIFSCQFNTENIKIARNLRLCFCFPKLLQEKNAFGIRLQVSPVPLS